MESACSSKRVHGNRTIMSFHVMHENPDRRGMKKGTPSKKENDCTGPNCFTGSIHQVFTYISSSGFRDQPKTRPEY